MLFALTGARVFDGTALLDRMAVVISGGRVAEVVPEQQLQQGIPCHRLPGGTLAPGFIDVQVNGGGGALFNADPCVATIAQIAAAHRRFGTTGLLPTFITDAPDVMARAILAVRQAQAQGVPGILGIHLEGPFLDPPRKGAHDGSRIRQMTSQDITDIAQAACGAVMLTLAPNRVPPAMVAQLVACGVLVSLGHSDATFDEAQQALGAGAQAFTHLFNAMSQCTPREPGMVGAALADQASYCGLIADGHHVHPANLRTALAARPLDRMMLISDAMPSAAGGPDGFTLQGRQVQRQNGRLQLGDGTLAGCDLTMDAAVRYCVLQLGVTLEGALAMASRNPANFIGCGHELGRILPGYRADLVYLDDSLHVQATWIEGEQAGEPF